MNDHEVRHTRDCKLEKGMLRITDVEAWTAADGMYYGARTTVTLVQTGKFNGDGSMSWGSLDEASRFLTTAVDFLASESAARKAGADG